MKFKLGALVAVVVAALLVVPPIVGRVGASDVQSEIVMQLDNPQAIKNGETQAITAEDGAALTPVKLQGRTLLPLRWFAETIGLTVDWDSATRTVTLTDAEQEKTHIVFAIDDPSMTVGDETKALDAPATLVNGVTYVPLRAIGEACGWNVQYVDDGQGALIFMDNHKKSAEPDEKQIADALAILGPSHTQMLTGGVLGRVDAGTLVINGSRVELKNAEDKYEGVIAQNGAIYLPAVTTAAALGGSAEITEQGGALTLGAQASKIAAESVYTDENGTVYVSAEAVAAAAGLQYSALSDTTFALTVHAIDAFADKKAYLNGIAQSLPDKRPDIPDAKGYIALTFDDGPTGGKSGLTVQLLDGLKERGAHATFFMCGYRIKDFHTHMDRYLAEGHELANHTMTHPQKPILSKLSVDKIYQEVVDNSELIKSYTGQGTTMMRPVGGSVSANLKEAMKKAGQPIINWSVDTLDWKYRDAERIKNTIVSEAKDGDIVLMHDLHQTTVAGALAAIDELQKQGYAFVTVSELAQIKGVTLEPGVVYTGFGDRKGYAG